MSKDAADALPQLLITYTPFGSKKPRVFATAYTKSQVADAMIDCAQHYPACTPQEEKAADIAIEAEEA